MSNPNHDPKTGEFTSGPGGSGEVSHRNVPASHGEEVKPSTRNDKYITDMGESVEIHGHPTLKRLSRYGVWAHDASKGAHQVVETGDNLDELMRRHNVPQSRVVRQGGEPLPRRGGQRFTRRVTGFSIKAEDER